MLCAKGQVDGLLYVIASVRIELAHIDQSLEELFQQPLVVSIVAQGQSTGLITQGT